MENTDRSKFIIKRLFEFIHKNELSNKDLVKIVTVIVEDILNAHTRISYSNEINPRTGKKRSYNAHKFAKGERFELRGIEFITDKT